MVLLRTRSGHVRLLEAYCPHLGAHLAVGGRVEGETLVCPFHGWRFDTASGRLLEVPYSPRCPKVRLRTAPVAVVDGLVHGFARPEAPGAPVHPR
jgi:phenylpropionate dioxygenase-like ring-hydroxylating dioxygenase large terminal subunit